MIFYDKVPVIHHGAMMVLWNCIQEADALESSTMKNSVTEMMILKHFKIANRLGHAPAITEVQWKAPLTGWIKINTDGAVSGSSSVYV